MQILTGWRWLEYCNQIAPFDPVYGCRIPFYEAATVNCGQTLSADGVCDAVCKHSMRRMRRLAAARCSTRGFALYTAFWCGWSLIPIVHKLIVFGLLRRKQAMRIFHDPNDNNATERLETPSTNFKNNITRLHPIHWLNSWNIRSQPTTKSTHQAKITITQAQKLK
mgnify:CR=1 FL=1